MDDQNPKTDSSEEEYHFATEPEVSGVFAPPIADKSEVMGRIKRKNILIALGVVIVVFCIYKLLDVLLTRHSHLAITPVTQTPTFPTPEPVTIAPPPPSSPAVVVAQPSAATDALNTRVSTLEEQGATSQAAIEKLNSEVADLQASISNLNSQLSSLNQGVQNIADELARQQAAKVRVTRKHRAKKRVVIVRPIYFVRALIPGRAWLVTQHGTTITVRLGDNLPGYGIVQIIDPIQGTVTTSAGAIIGYSPGDS